MNSNSTSTTPSAPPANRRPFHYVPLPRWLEDDARRYCRSLHDALRPWLDERLKALAQSEASEDLALHARLSDAAELPAQLCSALRQCMEWRGSWIAERLRQLGWPVDQDLMDRLWRWSHTLNRTKIEAWENRQAHGRRRCRHRNRPKPPAAV